MGTLVLCTISWLPSYVAADATLACGTRQHARHRDVQLCSILSKMCCAGKGDRTGMTPLHVAAGKGSYPLCRLLVQHGADCMVRPFLSPALDV